MDILETDIQNVLNDQNIPWEKLDNTNILITGATGLIGSFLTYTLVRYGHGIRVYVFVRNEEKAKKMFGDTVHYIVGDIIDPISTHDKIDYIIHCACQTASLAFVEKPVETIKTSVAGTINILEFAKQKSAKRVIYLSSMEVYGCPQNDRKIYEADGCNLDTMQVRSSYPESKRLCESLCCAYAKEYGVSASVIRLTQTFGAGGSYNDKRVFAEFARCVIENKDIVLNTEGKTTRSYLYITDAARAIISVLLSGVSGECYNAANEDTYCTIKEMADMVSKKCSESNIKVIINKDSAQEHGYAPTLKMNLDTAKLKKLGWRPHVNLEDAYKNLISYLEEEKV